ncbi:MAG TPA: helix-turn-helix transcriptional regulator [Pyrinomonadaceae bacterium]|jgi:cytoskeletal protein RodZ|nr:helix-turn-helix transcriptional regulator [Pyrinomonadaceae bacterium]
MAASFGEQLRLAREARGITLRHISDQTRISMRYLEAIESDDYKRLPGGIFNRSFIKSYAKQIGFDEKEAIEGYLRTAREQGESDEVATTPYRSHVYTDGGSRSPLVTLLLTVLILAVLSLGVYAAVHWYQRREAARSNNNAQPANTQPTNPTVNQNSTTTQTTPAAEFKNISITARGRVYVSWVVDSAKKLGGFIGPDKPAAGPFSPKERLLVRYDKTDAPLLEITIDGRPVKKLPDDTTQVEITKDNYEEFLR